MKREVLESLAEMWEKKGTEPDKMDGADDAKVENAKITQRCVTLRACAKDLRMLIALLSPEE